MTQLGIGSPDFQKYVNWRGTLYQTGAFSITSVTPISVKEYVTNFASTYLNVQLATGIGLTVTAAFYTDQTLATPAGSFSWILSSAPVSMQVIIPNLGNYLVITVSTGQAGNQTGTLSLTPTNIVVPSVRYPVTGNFAHGFSVNINAGATLTTEFPYVAEGNGQGFCQCSVATAPFTVEIDELNEGANILDEPFRAASVTGPQVWTFLAANVPCVLKITNNDAAAHTYTYHAQILSQ